MRKIGKKRAKEQSAAGEQRFPFRGLARESLLDAVILSGSGSCKMSWRRSARRCAASVTRIKHSGMRCGRGMCRVPWSWAAGASRFHVRGRPSDRLVADSFSGGLPKSGQTSFGGMLNALVLGSRFGSNSKAVVCIMVESSSNGRMPQRCRVVAAKPKRMSLRIRSAQLGLLM
jgi:hypothetical protein